MLIQTARDIPDALKALAADLRRLEQSTWADRITLALTMRKEGRDLARAAGGILADLAQTRLPCELGYTHRVLALQHATAALQIGNRLKPSTLQHTGHNTIWHPEGFTVRIVGAQVIYQDRSRRIVVPLRAADAGPICELSRLRWEDTKQPLEGPAREQAQHRIIAALLFLDLPCRIYVD